MNVNIYMQAVHPIPKQAEKQVYLAGTYAGTEEVENKYQRRYVAKPVKPIIFTGADQLCSRCKNVLPIDAFDTFLKYPDVHKKTCMRCCELKNAMTKRNKKAAIDG